MSPFREGMKGIKALKVGHGRKRLPRELHNVFCFSLLPPNIADWVIYKERNLFLTI